jgi:hypothetical protein
MQDLDENGLRNKINHKEVEGRVSNGPAFLYN